MEVSEPFDCGYKGILDNPLPPGNQTPDSRCSEAHIDEVLDELWDMGIRQMEITNKFDNQLTGVAGDGGSTGLVVNTGQFGTSGSFWDFGPEASDPQPGDCDEHNHDRIPGTSPADLAGRDLRQRARRVPAGASRGDPHLHRRRRSATRRAFRTAMHGRDQLRRPCPRGDHGPGLRLRPRPHERARSRRGSRPG